MPRRMPSVRRAPPSRCAFFVMFALFAILPLVAQSPSPAVDTVLSASFALKDPAAVTKSLVSGAAKAATPADRMVILASLADYEERSGSLAEAARHFNEAAFAVPSARDDGLLLDSARCLMASGDADGADGLVRAVLLTCFDQSILVRARAYSAWIQLSSGDREGALSLIRSYAPTAAFSPYASALLFTLWWADNDADARKKLLDAYPASPEASIARGETRLSSAPFWFLMERSAERVALFAKEGAESLPTAQPVTVSTTLQTARPVPAPAAVAPTVAPKVTSTPATVTANASTPVPETGLWQQTGFFRVREYAEELRDKLKKAGFDSIIREEKRPSGTLYFSVLVPETADRAVGDRLKDAGFESYLVTD